MNNDYIVFYDNKYKFDDEFVYNCAKALLEPCPEKKYRGVERLGIIFSTAISEISNTYNDSCDITKEAFHEIIYEEACNCIKTLLSKYILETTDGTKDFYDNVKNHKSNIIDNLFFNSLFDVSFAMNYMSNIEYSYVNLMIGNRGDVNTIMFATQIDNFIDRLNENYK